MNSETSRDGADRATLGTNHSADGTAGVAGVTNGVPPPGVTTGATVAAEATPAIDDGHRRLLLKAAAYLLGYPDDELGTVLDEMRSDLEHVPPPAATDLMAAIAALRVIPPDMLTASYVASFDFSEARSLYLTAHELGDSRMRGQALLDLRAMLRAGGFEMPEGELPDYLPALLEYVAYAPPDVDTTSLERRLAAVCAQIRDALATEDPYRSVFVALCILLPLVEPAEAPGAEAEKAPGSTARRPRFPRHERADTAELPYPLHYE